MKATRLQIRSGFSLIELLVVITIITLLAALLAFTIPNIISTANETATKGTIKKVNELLGKRLHAITREFKDQEDRAVGGLPAYAIDFLSAAGGDKELAKVLGKKAFIRRHLPMTFAEAERTPTVDDSNHSTATENAELLYYVLTNGPQFDAAPVDTDIFRSTELADTDGDGAMEIVDAWGRPLRFYRWPTRLIRPATSGNEDDAQGVEDAIVGAPDPDAFILKIRPNLHDVVPGISARVLIATVNPAADAAVTFTDENTDTLAKELAKDPDDPLGKVTVLTHAPAPTPPPVLPPPAATFENEYHTPDTWHTPLIVSGGRDGVLGLFEPYDTANHGQLAQPDLTAAGLEGLLDNLTNRQE
ncbi:MAG: type II secretion system protein [Planctomycetaceae bacterium]